LKPTSCEEFVHLLTNNLSPAPAYFAQDVDLNRRGAAPLSEMSELASLTADDVLRLQDKGAVVVDTRSIIEFASGHVPGSVHISLTGQYASWAARILGLGNTIIIVGDDPEHVNESRTRLARVGIEKVAGYLHDGVVGWAEAGLELDSLPQLTVHDLHELCDREPETVAVLDVREAGERESGMIEGSHWIPLGKLESKLESNVDELDRARLVVVQCRSGYRSSIATSLLRRAGFSRVANLTGGFDAWKAAGLPCATPATASA